MADKELTALIDDIVQRKFVSLEAADAISAIKKLADEQRQTLATQVSVITNLNQTVSALTNENDVLKAAAATVASREDAVTKRETAALKNELDAAHSKDKADLTERLFNTVFRNIEVRRDMMGTQAPPPSANPNYYPPQTIPITESTKTVAG